MHLFHDEHMLLLLFIFIFVLGHKAKYILE